MTEWPDNDVVAQGVLDTVAARLDITPDSVYEWAGFAGSEWFYTLLDSIEAEDYFAALADNDTGDYPDVNYEHHVGPAVDRVEDAYIHARDLMREEHA